MKLRGKLPTWKGIRTPALMVTGLGFLCWAAFVWAFMAGLVAVGLSCFVLEYLSED